MKKITLQQWLSTIDALSEVRVVDIMFQGRSKKRYAGFTEVRCKASVGELEAPISSVWIGRADDGIVIELIPPKQYSTKRP